MSGTYTLNDIIQRTHESLIRSRLVHFQRHREDFEGFIEILAGTIGLRDPYLLVHSRGVASFARLLAVRMQLGPGPVELVAAGGLFHDIGKWGVPQAILSKRGMLSTVEYELIKRHADLGGTLLGASPEYHALVPIVRHHHEFFNGGGYPAGLAGDRIPIEARIVAVAEAVHSMMLDLPYRRAVPLPEIRTELRAKSGSQFDPGVVGAALQILEVTEGDNEA